MQIPMLSAKTSRFETGFTIRKLIFIILSLAALVCAILGSLYYQLLRNTGFGTLLAWCGVLAILLFTVLSKLLSRKDDYKRTLAIIFTATNPDEAKTYKSLKELVAKCEGTTKETLKGYTGYKACLAQNKELIGYMSTGSIAFDKYQGTPLASLLLRFVLAPFKIFATVDFILSGQLDNSKNRIMASTRWYPRWQEYSKGIISCLGKKIAPLILYIIASAIAASVLDDILAVNTGIIALIWFGFLGIMLQLLNFKGTRKLLVKITSDYTEKQVPQADFNICKAFANISPEYLRICIDSDFMQSTQQSPAEKEVIEGA